jgi:hypothetical protein
MARPSIVTVVFWGSMTGAVLLTLVLPSRGASLAVTIAAPLIVVLLAIVVTLVLGRRAGKGPGIDGPSSLGSLWSPAPKHLYTITVLGAALTWTMFGMHLGAALEVWDAGGTPDRLQRFIIALWLLMGLADVWWLLRARLTPAGPGLRESAAPAI